MGHRVLNIYMNNKKHGQCSRTYICTGYVTTHRAHVSQGISHDCDCLHAGHVTAAACEDMYVTQNMIVLTGYVSIVLSALIPHWSIWYVCGDAGSAIHSPHIPLPSSVPESLA